MAMFEIHAVDEQIKTLPTYKTASGSIATFETDMTENLIEVKCQIVAQQSGSGTPSPSNPRPIQTYTEMNVFATGKNLSEVSDTFKFNAQHCTYIYENNGVSITATNAFARIGFSYKVKMGQKYTISYYAYGTGDYNTVYYNDANIWQYSYGTQTATATRTKYTKTITATSDILFIGFYVTANNTSGDMIIEDFMVELGEETTSFIAYNGTTSNIPFGQTVANGVLDITTGKLRVTGVDVDLGSLSWTNVSGYAHHFNAVSGVNFKPNLTTGICSCFQIVYTSYAGMGNYTLRIENGTLTVRDDDYTSPSDLQTALSGQILVSELNTPIELNVSSVAIPTLNGTNNLLADTGNISEAKYILSVGEALRQG